MRAGVVTFSKATDTQVNLRVHSQGMSLKGILLFVQSYKPGSSNSEKFINPDLMKVTIMVNGLPNMLYNNSIKSKDIWEKASCCFVKTKKQNNGHES